MVCTQVVKKIPCMMCIINWLPQQWAWDLHRKRKTPFVYGISWLENTPLCNAQCTYAANLVFTSVLRKVPPRNVTTRDDGAYECQISTQSKMSHFVYLKVLGKHTTHTNNSLINCTVCKIASKIKCAPHQKRIFSNKPITDNSMLTNYTKSHPK